MWVWIADQLILCPSREHIFCESERRWIDWEGGRFETYVQRPNGNVGQHRADGEIDLLVLKFSETSGRAERATYHPADCWSDLTIIKLVTAATDWRRMGLAECMI